jgi:hypothetical protein
VSINIAMFTKIFHQYSELADQTFDWYPMDSKERYDENIKNNLDKLQQFNWIDSTFTYKFNSHGFRCEEFTEESGVMFLGCSHTCGIGLPIENTWAYLVSQQLNLKMINLGIGGSGADTAFRLANHYIPQLKPKILIHLQSYQARMCLVTEDIVHEFLPSTYPKEFENFYFQWMSYEENLVLNELKHNLAIEMICNKNNIKYISINLHEFQHLDSARDLIHHGIKSNLLLSEKVLNKINA